jgi:hypothetical protein
MPPEFQLIETVLASKGLHQPTLSILVPDAQLYEVLAIQPTGSISIGPQDDQVLFVGHSDRATAVSKFSAFLAYAAQHGCDFVLSPECSFPWEVLESALRAGRAPAEGKLWALGCETITPNKLVEVIQRNSNFDWIHEDIPQGAGKFLNVLAYVTATHNTSGQLRTVIVLQFKHSHMGGTTAERDAIRPGKAVYIWNNPNDNIRLMSLICSDAIEFDPPDGNPCNFDRNPYIVFHPQLISDPFHDIFRAYRSKLFEKDSSKRLEIITLNWARYFQLPNSGPNTHGGSAIYTRSPHFAFDDTRIVHNHRLGLHFAYWRPRRTQLNYFNFDEHVFHFRMPKVYQNVSGAHLARTGPEMVALLNWDSNRDAWVTAAMSDGFDLLCRNFDDNCYYCSVEPYTVMDRERLFMLSSGTLETPADNIGWEDPRNLESFEVQMDELSRRLTFTHETARNSSDYRNRQLAKYIELQKQILPLGSNYPENIEDLAPSWRLMPPRKETDLRFNLESSADEDAPRATVVFLGAVPKSDAIETYDRIVKLWGGRARALRLVVWYRDTNGRHQSIHSGLPSFDEDSQLGTSFSRGSQQ